MTAPTWEELRDAGRVLLDSPDRGLAIYPTIRGRVVIAVRAADGAVHLAPLELTALDDVANALAEAEARAVAAQEVLHEQESVIAAHHLILRAKGAP